VYFLDYLNHLVKKCPQPVFVTYDSGLAQPQVLSNLKAIDRNTTVLSTKIQITTPEFYSRFISYVDTKKAFETELSKEEKKRTLFVSDPEVLRTILSSAAPSKIPRSGVGFVNKVRWHVIASLRRDFRRQSFEELTKKKVKNPAAMEYKGLSDLDRFVIGLSDSTSSYRRNVTRLLLADRIAFGQESVVHALDLVFRGTLIYLATVKQESEVSPFYAHVWGFVKG
jgi:hypothetical protein